MTFQQAISKLQDLAIEGSPDLVAAVEITTALKPCSVYRLIERQQIPAVKVAGSWKTTKALFQMFWKRTMVPVKESQVIRLAQGNQRKLEIEEARAKVLGGGR